MEFLRALLRRLFPPTPPTPPYPLSDWSEMPADELPEGWEHDPEDPRQIRPQQDLTSWRVLSAHQGLRAAS